MPPPRETSPPDAEPLDVLIVEDEPRLREFLLQAAAELQMTAEAVGTGEAAVKRFGERPAAVLLLDLNLPGIDGYETLARVRRSSPSVAAVVLTAFGDLPAAQQALRQDVTDLLTKPCTLGELEQALCRALARSRRRPVVDVTGGEDGDADEADDARPMADVEREHILETLRRHDGNRTATARALGISLRTLQYRLRSYREEGHGTDVA